jgi:hypothetical protein
VFEQFSNSMRFPAYFGGNWNALSECVRDLSWIPADRYLLVIESADQMTDESIRSELLGILARAARQWANPLGRLGGQGVPFNVLLMAG